MELEKLLEQRKVLDKKINKLRDKKETQEKKSLIGKHFIYRNNCYSLPSKASDYWNTFYKVLSVKGNELKVLIFQKDSQGTISFQVTEQFSTICLQEEIKKEAFDSYFNSLLSEIQELK